MIQEVPCRIRGCHCNRLIGQSLNRHSLGSNPSTSTKVEGRVPRGSPPEDALDLTRSSASPLELDDVAQRGLTEHARVFTAEL